MQNNVGLKEGKNIDERLSWYAGIQYVYTPQNLRLRYNRMMSLFTNRNATSSILIPRTDQIQQAKLLINVKVALQQRAIMVTSFVRPSNVYRSNIKSQNQL